ncbi:hypothetical protein [Bradyrhizobium sp. CCBAU 21362]|uniref:hypothetical protein n=1 Tax=Bradyrhizobium sp. CCBAU 21362 TaxID=1325082 RepID=UPI002305FC9B|nr:hypothetical protein [Bradyrhizobium sp. CCBAU 21362]
MDQAGAKSQSYLVSHGHLQFNTGMRPPEAKNLRWRDVAIRADGQGRKFVVLHVRGKDKFRQLVAAGNVADYLERIRAIGKATKPDDFVFTTSTGKRSMSLYGSLITNLLTESGLLHSSSGSRRSTYCFRHTYATFRLTEGSTCIFSRSKWVVQMIEDHYGHINPVKNAARILQGLPGWESMTATPQGRRRDRPRERGYGKDPSHQAEGQEATPVLIEPRGRMNASSSMRRYERLTPQPMRRWRAELGVEDKKGRGLAYSVCVHPLR